MIPATVLYLLFLLRRKFSLEAVETAGRRWLGKALGRRHAASHKAHISI
jgi:hypothetical protein